MNPTAWSWPLVGLFWVLRRPGVWLQPIVGLTLVGLITIAGGILTGWLAWPGPTSGWLEWLLRVSLALGAGLAASVSSAALLTPLLMNLVLDNVAARVRQEAGQPLSATPLLASFTATVFLVLHTLPERLGWTLLAFAGGFTGPFAVPIAAYAWSRIATADAFDTALAAEGADLPTRRAARRRHRHALRLGSLSAGGLQLGLALLIIAWLLWLPALVAGAALYRIAQPPDPA